MKHRTMEFSAEQYSRYNLQVSKMKHRTMVYYSFCPRQDRTPKDYKRYQKNIAEQILKDGFREVFGISYIQECVGLGVHGKPFWKGGEKFFFNVSNTAGLVVCALSDMEVGIDAEWIRTIRFPLVRRCCSDQEIEYIMGRAGKRFSDAALDTQINQERFFQLWTLKESYIKFTGEGMYFSMQKVAFSIQEANGSKEIVCNQPGYFGQKRLGNYWISLCTREPSEVIWQEVTEKVN